MKRTTAPILAFLFLVSLSAPGRAKKPSPRPGDLSHPQKIPQAPSAPQTIAKGINMLAIDLYKTLAKEHTNKNLFFSPLSISSAFAMAYAGARGDTEVQMARVLHFSLPQSKFHPAFSSLVKSILASSREEGCTLRMANALWGQRGYGFLPQFEALLDKYYGSGFHEVDFVGNTEGTREEINSWIEKKTENKIKNLIAKGDINQLTRLVLTNAIYFKGIWASQFKKENTKPLPVHISQGKTVQTPMMFQEGEFPYHENKRLKILELPYQGGDLSMVILLPTQKDGLAPLESHLTEEGIRQSLNKLRKRKVDVYIPRFKLETKYYLARDLAMMGMPDAFSPRADFSGMTGHRELKISKVIHQAYVEVNEEGTEAAAATAVAVGLKAVMRHPVFRADHPFLFMIIHKETGTILFMGALKNPGR